MPNRKSLTIVAAVALLALTGRASAGPSSRPALAPTSQPAVHMRTPEAEREEIAVLPGYRLDLIAAEPDVISPTITVWDGNGRMYVAEMRSYMLDLDGRKAHSPMSRVSRFEDTDGDGTYDKRTVFVDKMMLPRMILPLDERVLIRETDTKDIYCYTDTDDDGVADKKERVYEGGRQEGNLEHQPSGLVWNLDNWIYVTHQTERFRFTRGKMEKETYDLNVGQWGLAMDDTGRLFFSTAGNENPAHHFQVMPPYGDVNLSGQLAEGFTEVFPLLRMTDVQGGLPRLKPEPEGGLNRFTSCSGVSIFRGDALPPELYGNYILPEPVGRLVRSAKVLNENGKIVIASATPKGEEFINSTDPNFRPVWSATGPDGTLYFCDMYHGIIQEANWTKEGSYLRGEIRKYGLEKNINGGRIWRLAHEQYPLRKPPRMLDETPAQLVRHLPDPNGWWRDTAQKLIILRGDTSVLPALGEMAVSHSNPLARLHAFWTIEGLDAVTVELVLAKLKDADARVRAAAVRIAEPLVRRNHAVVSRAVRDAAFDADPEVAKQVMLSMLYLKDRSAGFVVNRALHGSPRRDSAATKVLSEVHHVLQQNLQKQRTQAEQKKIMGLADPKLAALFEQGQTYYQQMCVSCHHPWGIGSNTPDGKSKIAPPLKGSRRVQGQPDLLARILLNGITGPHDNGVTYPEQMPTFRWADDERLAAVLTYVRNDWGNSASVVTPDMIARHRAEAEARNKPFLLAELPAPVVERRARQVVLTPPMATSHGTGLTTLASAAVSVGTDRDARLVWSASVPGSAVYQIKLRCEAFGPTAVTLKVGEKTFVGTIPSAGKGEIDVGAAQLSGTVAVELLPSAGEGRPWAPLNLHAVVLEQIE